MARPRIRSAARSSTAARGTLPGAGQALAALVCSASPNADTSEGRTPLRMTWLYAAAHRIAARSPSSDAWEDAVQWAALGTLEALAAGLPERAAYARGEQRALALMVDDRVCGLVGDSHALREVRVQRGNADRVVDPWEGAAPSSRRITRGDWRALRAFLQRTMPNPTGDRPAITRAILVGLYCDGETLPALADRLGLTLQLAMQARSRGLAAARAALSQCVMNPPSADAAVRGVVVQP